MSQPKWRFPRINRNRLFLFLAPVLLCLAIQNRFEITRADQPLASWLDYSPQLLAKNAQPDKLVLVYIFNPNDIPNAKMWPHISSSQIIARAFSEHEIVPIKGNLSNPVVADIQLSLRDKLGFDIGIPMIAIFKGPDMRIPVVIVDGFVPVDRIDATVLAAIAAAIDSRRTFWFHVRK